MSIVTPASSNPIEDIININPIRRMPNDAVILGVESVQEVQSLRYKAVDQLEDLIEVVSEDFILLKPDEHGIRKAVVFTQNEHNQGRIISELCDKYGDDKVFKILFNNIFELRKQIPPRVYIYMVLFITKTLMMIDDVGSPLELMNKSKDVARTVIDVCSGAAHSNKIPLGSLTTEIMDDHILNAITGEQGSDAEKEALRTILKVIRELTEEYEQGDLEDMVRKGMPNM